MIGKFEKGGLVPSPKKLDDVEGLADETIYNSGATPSADGIYFIKPYPSISWVCVKCARINSESFYKYRTSVLVECRACQACHKLGDID